MIDIIEPHIITRLDFEEELHHTRWECILSDNTVVYSHSKKRSWLQLKEWLLLRPHIHIEALRFAFRDNYVDIYRGEADYFFTHAITGEYGGPVISYFIGGYRKPGDNHVFCKKYLIPEMFLIEEEKRSLEDASVIKGLIKYEKNISQQIY